MLEPSKNFSEIPEEFLCPISHDLMEDPVCTTSGKIYDKKNITAWFKKRDTDPLTNLDIADKTLTPLPELKKKIEDYKKGEAIGFYHSGLEAIKNKAYVPAKAFFKAAIETQKPGELSEEQNQLAQYYIHKILKRNLKSIACLTKAALLNSTIALSELQENAFLTIDSETDDNKLFLLSVCAALALGFSGQPDIFVGENSPWQNKCSSHIGGIFGNRSISFSGKYLSNANEYFDWVRKEGPNTTLNFFHYCVSQKIITLPVYIKIIMELLKNNKNNNFKDKAYYNLHKAILLIEPHKCNDYYLSKISPKFLSSQINNPKELVRLKNIFKSISDGAMRGRLETAFFTACSVGSMITTSGQNNKACLSKSNTVSIGEESWLHYTQGCQSMAEKNYIPAKAHFMAAIEIGFQHPEHLCDAYYRLGIVHRHSKQYVEAMGCFTKARLLNTEKSEQVIKELLDHSLIPDELLAVCSIITWAFSDQFFTEKNFDRLSGSDNHFNQYKSSFTTRDHFGFDNSKRIPSEWITMIGCNLDNLKKTLQFFNYCVSRRIITPEIYEKIILGLNIPLEKINQNGDIDEINESHYVLFKTFLSINLQKAEDYLEKIPPVCFYAQLNNSSEFYDLRKIPLRLKYDILEKLSSMTEAFQDPNYCKIVSAFLDAILANSVVPKKILEAHIKNLYMCNSHYDVLQLRESALKRLTEHPDKSISLSTSMMHSHVITDNDKMSCAIHHIVTLLSSCGYSGIWLKKAETIAHLIQQPFPQPSHHQTIREEYNFRLLKEFHELFCNKKVKTLNPDMIGAFQESKRILRAVIEDVGYNITLPPIVSENIENAISDMLLLLKILFRSKKSQNSQETDSLFSAAMTFFEKSFTPNPEVALIQSCLKETARIQAVIDDATLTTEDLLPLLRNFNRYIALIKKENVSVLKNDSLDVLNQMSKTSSNIIDRLDKTLKQYSTAESLSKPKPFS